MNFVVTLVSPNESMPPDLPENIRQFLQTGGLLPQGAPAWLSPLKAADLFLGKKPGPEHIKTLRTMLAAHRVDFFVSDAANRQKKMLVADMDSTIVKGEVLDELAARAGLGEKIAAITARAMRGEMDFEEALRTRISMMSGLPQELLQETLDHTALNPGAETLVKTMAARGAVCILVSGGFTFFTEKIAERAGFHHHHGNTLEIEGGRLTGAVTGDILGKEKKQEILFCRAAERGLKGGDVLALGDGANDLLMLQAAGLGIGYHPKPLLRETLDNCILYGDLSAALYAQGLKPAG